MIKSNQISDLHYKKNDNDRMTRKADFKQKILKIIVKMA